MTVMYIVKKIIVKSVISLFVGAASVIGTKLATTMWDKCACDETFKKKEQTFAQ